MIHILEITWIIWFLSEILLNRLMRSKTNDSKDLDKSSLRFIWIGISISMTLGIICTMNFSFPITKTNLFEICGTILLISGIVIRFISIRTLGKFFTVDLAVHSDHKLVNSGMYKYVRHPSYSGALLSFFGFGLSLNNWLSLIIIFIPIYLTFIYRINIEEKLLTQRLGEEYLNYKKNTKRLIPMIY